MKKTTDSERVDILLVDDRPENLSLMEAVLAGDGHDIVKASSGKEAVRLASERDFALILMDVMMPEMDGYETASLIRGSERSRLTPIIFVTALGRTTEGMSRGYSIGAVDYLFKPIEPAMLMAKAGVFIELHKKTRALDRMNRENEALIAELREALSKVKTLSGLLPICAWCKKIRDDGGYWKQVEAYIQERSEASFTHGICPECMKTVFDREEEEISQHDAGRVRHGG